MKRVKPGRAPSAMGAAMSAVVAVFGVFWTIAALSMGAPVFFRIVRCGFCSCSHSAGSV